MKKKKNEYSFLKFPTEFLETDRVFTKKEVKDIDKDERFMRVLIKVCHSGLNLNGSIFSTDMLHMLGENMGYVPLVGKINEDRNDFLGHEEVVVYNEKNDDWDFLYDGHAYGLIPEKPNYKVSSMESEDGVVRDYLIVEGYLWTKFTDAIQIFKDSNFKKKHSMELFVDDIDGYWNEDDYFVFTKAKCDGLCILGESHNPAMIDSNVTVVNDTYSKKQFDTSSLMEEVLNVFNKNYEHKSYELKEDETLDKNKEAKKEVVEKDNITISMSDYNDLKKKADNYETIAIEKEDLLKYKKSIEKTQKETMLKDNKEKLQKTEYERLKKEADKFELEDFEKEIAFSIFKKPVEKPIEEKFAEKKEVDVEPKGEERTKDVLMAYKAKAEVEETDPKTDEQKEYDKIYDQFMAGNANGNPIVAKSMADFFMKKNK